MLEGKNFRCYPHVMLHQVGKFDHICILDLLNDVFYYLFYYLLGEICANRHPTTFVIDLTSFNIIDAGEMSN